MDAFGIGQAMKGMAKVYFQTSRNSGRTVSMLEALKDGDRIVFDNPREAKRVSNMCRERELDVECIVIKPCEAQDIFNRGSSQGRTIFDHNWVEQYYLMNLESLGKELDFLQRETSGYGEAHLETRSKAKSIHLWQF